MAPSELQVDVSAITERTSFLRSFIVSHGNLEIERDFENVEAQHTEVLKELGSFRGQLNKLNSKSFKASDPRLTKAGSKFCFRCKLYSRYVKLEMHRGSETQGFKGQSFGCSD